MVPLNVKDINQIQDQTAKPLKVRHLAECPTPMNRVRVHVQPFMYSKFCLYICFEGVWSSGFSRRQHQDAKV